MKKLIIATFILLIIINIGLLVLDKVTIFGFEFSNIALYIGSIGIINFFSLLIIISYLSGSENLKKGEMRKAIAGSFIIVYFVLLSLITLNGNSVSDTDLSKTMIDHFTYLVGIIVVFYFGSRSVEEYLRNKKESIPLKTNLLKEEQKLLKIKQEMERNNQKEPKLNKKNLK